MEECVFTSQLGFISEHVSWLSFTERRALFQHILRDAKKSTFGKGLLPAPVEG